MTGRGEEGPRGRDPGADRPGGRRPTPLDTPLRVVARHTRRDGRRIFATGELLAGGEVTAEAKGVFAEITMARARALFGSLGILPGRETG